MYPKSTIVKEDTPPFSAAHSAQEQAHALLNVYVVRLKRSAPQELQDLDQWVTWKYETRPGQDKPTKVPYNPKTGQRADTTDPATWGTLADACAAYVRGGYEGTGFVVTEDDAYCGVDIDDCIVDGELTPNVRRWVDLLNSYTEVTPSQKGVRVWIRGIKPGERCKHTKLKVEIYGGGRYFTVTGNHLPGTPTTINNRQKALTSLYNELFPQEQQQAPQHRAAADVDAIPQDDRVLLERMFASRSGYKIRSLWNGDTSGHNGDDSSADLALLNYLAFWTGCDEQRMDRMFRQSGLMRPKWDSKRTGGTWGSISIGKAIKSCRQTYDPKRRRDDDDRPGSGGNAPQVDVQATFNQARQWIKRNNFLPYIDPELLPESGSLRRPDVLKRVADAVIDVLEEYKSLSGFISLREIRRRAGVGVESVRRAMARLMPWFVALTDHEQNKQQGGALHYVLSFRDNGTPIIHKEIDGGGCLAIAKTPFTLHKAHDAFNMGGNREMRNAALRHVIGRSAVDVLVQLEGYDSPRRDAWTDYRKAQREMEERGEAVTDQDVAALMTLADGLIDEPQPVILAALAHLADYRTGLATLADLGAIVLDGDTVRLLPDYAKPINAQVASLGPVALLLIDASVEHGDLTYEEFTQHTGLKYGTVARAMSKLLKRGIYAGDREGLAKRFTLCHDWLPEVEAQAHTMRTYGLQQKREIADATAVYNYVGVLLKTAHVDRQPKLERRRERAFTRLMAAVALEAPTLATKTDFAVAMRLSGNRHSQAPTMTPGTLAHAARYAVDDMSVYDAYAELAAAEQRGEVNTVTSDWVTPVMDLTGLTRSLTRGEVYA